MTNSAPSAAAWRRAETLSLGMWAFLASEVMFFGAVLMVYAQARITHSHEFLAAARSTSLTLGAINTAVLLTSSLAMALAVSAHGFGLKRIAVACLGVTALLGLVFLTIKGIEYYDDIVRGLFPGLSFSLATRGAFLFFGLYWLTTGVHALHVAIGIIMVSWAAISMLFRHGRSDSLEAIGLYWHFVDLVWIMLFALLYLGGRVS